MVNESGTAKIATASVHVLPDGFDIEVEPDETLFEAASRQGLRWPTRCHGQAQCMLCAVELDSDDGVSPPQPEEQAAMARMQSLRGSDYRCRLACRMRVTGTIVVRKTGVRHG